MWDIVSAKPGSKIVYGVASGITREDFAKSVKEGRIESCLNFIDIKKGDYI